MACFFFPLVTRSKRFRGTEFHERAVQYSSFGHMVFPITGKAACPVVVRLERKC